MADAQRFELYEEEARRIGEICLQLREQSAARVVYLTGAAGQLIEACGEVEDLDTASLASLTAGTVAATAGLAKLLRERELSTKLLEGRRTTIYLVVLGQVILGVIFDERSNLGLVRLRCRRASPQLAEVLAAPPTRPTSGPLLEVTEDDISRILSGHGRGDG
jgi:predicted regulator of Ras-like GTPase activity (Roadblock/LC7/MglB family)